jgi:hypothetical protein
MARSSCTAPFGKKYRTGAEEEEVSAEAEEEGGGEEEEAEAEKKSRLPSNAPLEHTVDATCRDRSPPTRYLRLYKSDRIMSADHQRTVTQRTQLEDENFHLDPQNRENMGSRDLEVCQRHRGKDIEP